MKKYILTIEYNEDTEEIEYVQEEIIDDIDSPEVLLSDIEKGYLDEETVAKFAIMFGHRVGVA